MNVLVACEESQTVTKEFLKLGHNAFSCDIQDCSGGLLDRHIKGDVLPLINGDCTFKTCDNVLHEINGTWDLIIAHPPCTYLSRAGSCYLFDKQHNINNERYKLGLAARDFFLMFLNADCDRIAVENPVPITIYNLPPCSQEIQPYMFGDPYQKTTRLWLKNLPNLFATEFVYPYRPWCPSKKYSGAAGSSKKKRSKTFPGIAAAMASQWSDI